MFRALATLILFTSLSSNYAQMILEKHLIIGLSGGGGISSTRSDLAPFNSSSIHSSGVRFSFAYAFNPKWSLGGHYDRIGSVKFPGSFDRIRFTTYLLEGTYRPVNRERSAVELMVAGGVGSLTLRPSGDRFPYEAVGATLGLGIRYLFLINETIGMYVSADHTQGLSSTVKYTDPDLELLKADIEWHSQRITGGMFVRF